VGASAPVKYHYSYSCLTYSMMEGVAQATFWNQGRSSADLRGGHCQVGSLAGAAHLLNDNAGVLR